MSKESDKILLKSQIASLLAMQKFIQIPSLFSETFKSDVDKSLNETITEMVIELERLESTSE